MRIAAAAAAAALLFPAAGSGATWTLAQARAHLRGVDALQAVDSTQSDRPAFSLRFDARATARLRGVGAGHVVRGVRRWGSFSFAGTALDLVSDRDVLVSFRLPAGGRSPLARFRGPPPDSTAAGLPLRGAFFYPWFPEAWDQAGFDPFTRYSPSLGFYDSGEAPVLRRQVDAMLYGKIRLGISSWWGRGTPTDRRVRTELAVARATPFRWAVYYEDEGYSDPPVERLRADLEYLREAYAAAPAYLRLDGRFVVFVYGGAESCATVERWREANTVGAYLVLKAFPGFRECAAQPDGWHQYLPVVDELTQPGYAFEISPGFYRIDEEPRLARDLERWRRDVRDMVASGAPFQLVTTFNEWGEGTSIESADQWATLSSHGAYLDALHDDGAEPAP